MDKVTALKSQYSFRDVAYSFVGEVMGKGRDFTQHACLYCDSSDAFTVYNESFFCYSCEKHGDVIDLLAYKNNQTVGDFLRGNDCEISVAEIEKLREQNAERARERKEVADREYKNAYDRLQDVKAWIRYASNLSNTPNAQGLWNLRGVPNEWQSFFGLGYSPDFKYTTKTGKATSQTLVIPVRKIGGEVITIRHRLLNALDGDKYRPDMAGLGSHPYLCDVDNDKKGDLIIVEGEIKSMVTYLTYDKPGTQVVGVPSKSMMRDIVQKAQGRNAVVIPDPDGISDIVPVVRQAGARLLMLPEKVDDFIIQESLDTSWLRYAIKQARVV